MQNAVEVSQFLPQAKIVPVHADSWAHFSESIDDVTQAFAAAQLSERLLVAPLGVPVELN